MAGSNITLPQAGDEVTAAWGQSVAVAVNGVQSGTANCVHSGTQVSPTVTVTFPRAYKTPPLVVVGSTNYNYGVGTNGAQATTTGFVVATYRYSGVATATIAVNWIAHGELA